MEDIKAAGETTKWQETINKCIPSIVVIRVCSVRAFDGDGASYSYATGFVVDAKAGIILTGALDQSTTLDRRASQHCRL